MVCLLTGPDYHNALSRWAIHQIPHVSPEGFGPCQIIGIAGGPSPDDELYGVLVCHDWQPLAKTLQLTVAARSPRWVWAMKPLLSYCFDQLKVYKIFTATPHNHMRALKYNAGIGFKREAVLRHQFGRGIHAVIFSMIEPEYRASRWCAQKKKAA